MTINLGRKPIRDIVEIPLSLEKGRLKVEPSKNNQVYKINRQLIHHQLAPEISIYIYFNYIWREYR